MPGSLFSLLDIPKRWVMSPSPPRCGQRSAIPTNLVNARIRWGSHSVRSVVRPSTVVVLSFVPVAGSHLSELIMCDKTGMAEGGKEGREEESSLEPTR